MEYEEVRNKPVKSLRQSREGDPKKPQIVLFDFEGAEHLPIKRIIVGPQTDQSSAVAMAKRLVAGTSINVTASKTPLVQGPRADQSVERPIMGQGQNSPASVMFRTTLPRD